MSAEVCGVDLSKFVGPIQAALGNCQSMSEDRVTFGPKIPDFILTPDRPNSARTATDISLLGQNIGKFTIIVYAPGDGTGDESLYKLNEVSFENGEATTRRIPRSKSAVWGEMHLVVAAADPDSPNNDPVVGAGGLEVVTFLPNSNTVRRGFVLGAKPEDVESQITGDERVAITRTLTCGPIDMLQDVQSTNDRFGDPHATFNPTGFVQVCAYFGLSPDAPVDQRNIFGHLQAKMPILI